MVAVRDLSWVCLLVAACGDCAAPSIGDASLTHDAGVRSADSGRGPDAAVRADSGEQTDASLVADSGAHADAAAVSADSGALDAGPRRARIAFSRLEGGQSGIHTVLDDGAGLTALTVGPGGDYSPAWSPDGRRLAFTSSRNGSFALYILDLTSGLTSSVPTGLFRSGSPAWHPTSGTLALEGVAAPGQNGDIYTFTSAGQIQQLTADPANDVGPVFAPDGLSLFFVSNRSGSYEIYRLTLASGQAVVLTSASDILGRPTINGDGCELVYARAVGAGDSELVRLDLCGGSMTPVSLNQSGSEPSFGGDGALVFSTARFGGSALMWWPQRQAAPLRLPTGPGWASEPAISP